MMPTQPKRDCRRARAGAGRNPGPHAHSNSADELAIGPALTRALEKAPTGRQTEISVADENKACAQSLAQQAEMFFHLDSLTFLSKVPTLSLRQRD